MQVLNATKQQNELRNGSDNFTISTRSSAPHFLLSDFAVACLSFISAMTPVFGVTRVTAPSYPNL
jgi:hypothetical protein